MSPSEKSPETIPVCGSPGATRRDFLKTSLLATGVTLVSAQAHAIDAHATSNPVSAKLTTGWEYYRGSLGGVWDVWREDMAESTVWKRVTIPHCFNAYDAVDPDQSFYEGPGWYRRKLQVWNPYDKGRTLLLFEGAGQKAQVFIGYEKVGEHVGGYDEFTVDISEATTKVATDTPEVPLAVLCDNSRDREIIPSSLNDFHRFGGLYRDVTLSYVPAISIRQVHITAALSDSASADVSFKAKLHNPLKLKEEIQLQIRVLDPRGVLVQTTIAHFQTWEGEREVAALKLDKPHLWSPAQPSLYLCEIQLTSSHGTMRVSERFGCRYFEFVEHGPFKLNGERLFLKGTQREEDYSGCGAAVPEDVTRRELTLIKEMGANFLGLAHHQQSRTVLDLCDELGLLVLEEIPWSRGGIGGEDYKQLAREMLRAMIDQHYNHPSVVLWGIGNENDWPGDFPNFDKEKIRAFVKELNDEAHELDPGRGTFLRRCDFAKDLVDVYSPSIWAGWYHGPYTSYKDKIQKASETVPRLLHVEWGAESHARRHSEEVDGLLTNFLSGNGSDRRNTEYLLNGGETTAFRDGDWSETYACNLFDWHLKEQETMGSLAGSAQWIFKDFSTPLRSDNPVPHVNQKGLVERDMTLKEGYYVFQSYWSEKPMVRIYGHSWPIRWGELEGLKLIKVYSNCETAELFLNDISQGVKHRNPQDFPAAGLHWLVKFGSGENHLRAVGWKEKTKVEDSLVLHYQAEKWSAPAKVDLTEIGRNKDRIVVEALLRDKKGTQCLAARNRVLFGITGDGTLLDDLGTSTASRSVQLYNGRAEIGVSMNPGTAVVSARVPGIATAFVTLS
jgi:beta-galactosidase